MLSFNIIFHFAWNTGILKTLKFMGAILLEGLQNSNFKIREPLGTIYFVKKA